MTRYTITAGSPRLMGATHDGEGVNFAVFSAHARSIELCLFDAAGKDEIQRLRLPERTGAIWHGHVAGLPHGTLYGFRADGVYDPEHGHRFNPHKLLLDPYTREFHGSFVNSPDIYGYDLDDPRADLSFSTSDSAHAVPKSVISHPDLLDPALSPLSGATPSELIYEAHAKGLTKLHPDVSEAVRGTYEGLCTAPIIEHLHKLGVTAIELLPVQAFPDDGFLIDKGLRNYWGYNTIGFFAPEPRYFGPAGFAGFRDMVRRFHEAGIKVYLDVVYNHTAEGDHRGPTWSFRGLDNLSYYRLMNGQQRYYVNDAGTGNTLDMINPHVLRMVMDSLRFWVSQMGIDGFRFDLATVLGRESYGFDPRCGLFDAMQQDPVLGQVTMIAEPWDLGPGGYQLGNFPPDFREWNDSYRDTVRRYWKGDDHAAQELGARVLGSADRFDHSGRRASSSVNFLTSHDGFTLADLTSYTRRHNEANGENGHDGHSNNHSDNMGVEGPTEDPDILARRARRRRNMLATLFLSQGTPMLLAGDEIANSQGGNNNVYCQDNPTGWINWDDADWELAEFVARLSRFRQAHLPVRQEHFLHGKQRPWDSEQDVRWTDFDGDALQWRDPGLTKLCLTLRASAEFPQGGHSDEAVVIAFNRSDKDETLTLPKGPRGYVWRREIDTSAPDLPPANVTEATTPISAKSVTALVLVKEETAP